ncbi:DUF4321 domain-containing protein [Tepidibacillus fermentans]|uniref:Uncharacterized protein DUF4321 n=1 Tax=Tepidibacillus fermentans TaxID=1281767 RepID=A0A4R3K844_9BACI|nr:DUF4321 domain-containing protein [Tepidibacillus fermentans]TCS79057.1 uncharacterized protein DUF4321 [Tepidibacillus fermentans]
MKKKQTSILILLLVIGLILGSLLGEIFADTLPFLAKSQQIVWHPQGDFNILKYDFNIQVKLNIASILGLALAFWIYRKL